MINITKKFAALAAFFLLILAAIVPAAGSTVGNPAGAGGDATVTITKPAQVKYHIWEDTITFSGTNTASGTTYLFITGPNLKTTGAQIQSIHPGQSPVADGDASTFLAARVGPDHSWSYTWDTHNVMIDSGSYTVYAASTPRDLSHINSTHFDRFTFILAPPSGLNLADSGAAAGSDISGNGTIAGKGVVTIVAAGSQAYPLGEEIQFTGTNTASWKTYLFLTGPNLPENGAYIASIVPRDNPSKDNDPSTFKSLDVNGDRTWSWKWGTAGSRLDAGSYTVYAVSEPLARGSLEQAAYGTVPIIIKRPLASATLVDTAASARSPGFGFLVALAGLGAVAFTAVHRR